MNAAENRRRVALLRAAGADAEALQRKLEKQNVKRLALRAKGKPSPFRVGEGDSTGDHFIREHLAEREARS